MNPESNTTTIIQKTQSYAQQICYKLSKKQKVLEIHRSMSANKNRNRQNYCRGIKMTLPLKQNHPKCNIVNNKQQKCKNVIKLCNSASKQKSNLNIRQTSIRKETKYQTKSPNRIILDKNMLNRRQSQIRFVYNRRDYDHLMIQKSMGIKTPYDTAYSSCMHSLQNQKSFRLEQNSNSLIDEQSFTKQQYKCQNLDNEDVWLKSMNNMSKLINKSGRIVKLEQNARRTQTILSSKESQIEYSQRSQIEEFSKSKFFQLSEYKINIIEQDQKQR